MHLRRIIVLYTQYLCIARGVERAIPCTGEYAIEMYELAVRLIHTSGADG